MDSPVAPPNMKMANISDGLRELLMQPEKQKFSQHDIAEHYDEAAVHYDNMYLSMGYYDHIKCAELAEKYTPEEARDQCAVFDMGCGTGLVGEVLQPKGFNNIVGCDASPGILKHALAKLDGKAYVEAIELFLGMPDTFPEALKGRFDIVTATGILA